MGVEGDGGVGGGEGVKGLLLPSEATVGGAGFHTRFMGKAGPEHHLLGFVWDPGTTPISLLGREMSSTRPLPYRRIQRTWIMRISSFTPMH